MSRTAIEKRSFEKSVAVPLAYSFDRLARQALSRDQIDSIYSSAQAAQNHAARLSKLAYQLWESACLDDRFDPWSRLDAQARTTAVQRLSGNESEQRLRRELTRMAKEGLYPIPLHGLETVGDRLSQSNARFGIVGLHSAPQAGMREIRTALRMGLDEETVSALVRSMQTVIDRFLAASEFEKLYDTAVFMVGEIGLDRMSAGQRSDFAQTMGKAKSGLSAGSALELAFIESLLADTGNPGALEAAFTHGFQAVNHGNAKSDTGKSHEVSRIRGASSIAVENGTDHLLLCFYKGPEQFFLRIAPQSRATIVLEDGNWQIATLAPDRGIQPLLQNATLDGGHKTVAYTIERSDRSRDNAYAFGVPLGSGDYSLARAPARFESVRVDPDTGIPSL